jgi:hypothetical protein
LEANPPLRLLASFQQELNKTPALLVQMDGREMWIAAEIIGGFSYTVIVPDLRARLRFDRSSIKRKRTLRNRPLPDWSSYLTGTVGVLARMGLEMPGATIVIAGDEPIGPRYNYSLGMAFAALWYEYNERQYTTRSLLELMEKVQRNLESDK